MTVPVLRELVEGNLAKASLSGAVKETVDTYRHNCECRPGIYTMIIADAHGNAPSPKELLKVIKVVRMYCKQGSDADKVARSLTQRRGFTLFGLPLCFLTKPIQSSLAEIMFTVMGNGYASNGTGFNSEPTDENNDSANQIDQRIWANNTGCVYLTTPLNLNMENETIHLEIVSSRQPGDEEIPPDYLLQYLRTKLEAILQMPDESDNWPEELMESSEEVSKLDQAEQEQDMRRERETQDLVAKVDELEKALEGLL
ncbi:Carbohydrate esterase family 15 protein [Neofusicoccum parvum]|nr:Carbohydrate esterase family 15 protein [Neofusicoccum parvum]